MSYCNWDRPGQTGLNRNSLNQDKLGQTGPNWAKPGQRAPAAAVMLQRQRIKYSDKFIDLKYGCFLSVQHNLIRLHYSPGTGSDRVQQGPGNTF